MNSYVWPVISDCTHILFTLHESDGEEKKHFPDHLCQIQRSSGKRNSWSTVQREAEKRCLHGGSELTPTHGQVHIPMSTKAAAMCLHATPTVSRAASNDHHMPTFCLLPALEHMEPQTTAKNKTKHNIWELLNRVMGGGGNLSDVIPAVD